MNLPVPVRTYFDADASGDADALAAAFAPDGVVQDEGQSHVGPLAIARWWLGARARYRHSATPLDATRTGAAALVRARVEGDFPGSPAVLTFSFALDGGLIRELRIGA